MDENPYLYSNEQKIIQIIDENNLDDDYDDLISVRVESDDEDDDEDEEDDGNYRLNISYERNLENMEEDNDTQDTILYEIPREFVKENDDETLHAIEIRSKIIPTATGNMIKLEKDGIKQEVDIRSISDNDNSIEIDDFTGFENNAHYVQKSSLSEILKFDTLNVKQEEPLNIDDVLFDSRSNSPIDIFEILKTEDEESQNVLTQKDEQLVSSSPILSSSQIDLLSPAGPSSLKQLPFSQTELPTSQTEPPSSEIESPAPLIEQSISFRELLTSHIEPLSLPNEPPCLCKEPSSLPTELPSLPKELPSLPKELPSLPKESPPLPQEESMFKIEPNPVVLIEDVPLDEEMCDISLIMNDHSYLSQEQVNNILHNNNKHSTNISVNNNNDSLSIINLLNLINKKLSCTDNYASTKNTELNEVDKNVNNNLEISVNVISKLIESLAYNNDNSNSEKDGLIDSSRNNNNINNFIKNIENNLNLLKRTFKVTECDREVMNNDENGAPSVSNIEGNIAVLHNNDHANDNNNKDEAEVVNGGNNLNAGSQIDMDKSADYDDDEHMILRMDEDSTPSYEDINAQHLAASKPIDKDVNGLENEKLPIASDVRIIVENEKPAHEESFTETSEDKYNEFELLGKKILDKRILWVENLKDPEKSEIVNNEIANFIIEIRKDLSVISQKRDCCIGISCEQTTQTDEKVSIESARKLNESYKRRHLASSSSDVSSDLLDSEEDFFITKRRKKRTKKKHIKSNIETDDDKDDIDKKSVVSPAIEEQNSENFIAVKQDDTEENKKDIDMSQIELDISEYLVRKPVDSSVSKTVETSKETDQPNKKEIFDMPTQKFVSGDNGEECDTQIIKSDNEIDHNEDDNTFNAPTQRFVPKDKEKNNQQEDDENILLDREIDRATNFANLDKKRLPSENHTKEREIRKKKKKKDNMIDIIKEAEKKEDSDESSDNNDEPMTDEQYLRNKNLETKWSLLNSSDSSDDSINSDDMEDIENYMRVSSDERSSDESSEVDKFLESMNNKTIENEIKKSIEQVEGEVEKSNSLTTSETKEMKNESEKKKLDEQPQNNKAVDLDPVDKENDDGQTSPDLDTEAFENFWKEHSTNHDEILNEAIASGDMNVEEVDNVNACDESVKQDCKERKSEAEDSSIDKDDVDENLLNCEVILTEGKEEDLQSKEIEAVAKITKPKTKRDNLDKELFSKSLLNDDNVDSETEDAKIAAEVKPDTKKLTDKEDTKSEITSNAGDSDCEILDISMFQSKRKIKEPVDIETLLNASAKKSKTAAGGTTTSANSTSGTNENSKGDDDCIYLSSDSDSSDLEEVVRDEEEIDNEESSATRKKPRAILTDDQLTVETKQAQKEESDRIKRLEKKHDMMSQRLSQMTQSQIESTESEIILDYDTKRKQNICVHPEIVKHLKPHQIDGVKFMYDSCYGSVDNIEKYPGSGCILAHCMGLGKTLQLIAVLHTLIRYPQLKTHRILVICPKSTVMNWSEEIQRWLGPIKTGPKLKVFHFPDNSDINDKMKILKEWHKCGTAGYTKSGCLLLGYEAFRTLVFYHLSKKKSINLGQSEIESIKKIVNSTLLNPGADLIICDEGHMIKNKKSATNVSVSQVKTKRRVILTGTPIQNNLKEYYCMVNFIKPSFLGTEKEFANLYANPIKSGQHKDSSKSEIKFMKQRSFVLHKKLSKFVQRREAAVLKTFLPEKFEYVLFIPMTPIQEKLYEYFLENNSLKEKYGGKSLIPDYTFLRKIWTHPKVLENAWQNAVTKREKEKVRIRKILNESDDDRPDDELDSQTGKMSVLSDWWRQHITQEDLESLFSSNKLRVMFEILKLCEENGEKCLIFSAFVAVLNAVEFFMQKIHKRDEATMHRYGLARFRGPWVLGQDYYRLDGKTPKTVRHAMITKFNSPENRRTKCFLISAKAGGQGINLIGANRVIILDTSWNPSNDQQNIFRIFRLGQKLPCFVYRILAMGTMEEKVYSRSVTKQAMSFRVVDEQQIDRHYSMAELAELYTLTKTDYTQRPVPIRPVDNLLSSLLHHFPDLVYKYHEHDSLLENKPEQDLSEADKAEAWAAYEKDVQRTAMLDPLNEMNLLNAQQNYRMGTGLGYPYGYNNKGMNFGIVNNPNYASALGSSFMSGYLNPYQSLFSSLSTDPNIMRMRQMYQNPATTQYPYGNLNSPTGGQSNGLMDAFGGSGAPALFGGNLINQSPYYKSLTPPIPPPPSTIRPKAGFSSMDDVANFLAGPSSNTPPPPPPQSSSASVPVSSPLANASLFNKELDTSLFKQYFSNPTLFNSPLGSGMAQSNMGHSSMAQSSMTQSSMAQSAIAQLGQNSVSMPVVPSGSLSTASSGLTNQLVTTKSLGNVQPSIPTSVITKPVGRPPIAKEPKLPTSSALTSTNAAPATINSNSGGRYSPQPHVIVKSKTQTPVSSVNVLPPTTPAITTNSPTVINSTAAATLVKNYNMGIVYPKDNATKNNSPAAASLSAATKSPSSSAIKPHLIRKSNTTPLNSIKSSVSTPNLTKAITSSSSTTTGLSKSNINTTASSTKKQQDDLVNLYMKKLHMMTSHLTTSTTTTLSSASRPIVSNNNSNNLNDSSKGLKKTNTYQLGNININELTKSSGLSITPVNSTKTTPTSTVQQIQATNINKIPKGVTVKSLKIQNPSIPVIPPQTQGQNKLSGNGTSILHNAMVATGVGVPGSNKVIRRSGPPPQTVSNNNTTIIPVPQHNLVTAPSNTMMGSGPQQKIIVSSNGSNSGVTNSGLRYVVTPTTSSTNQTKYVGLGQQQHQGTGKTVPPLVLSRNSNNANIMKPIRLTETYGKKKVLNASGTGITTTLPSVAPKQLANQTVVRALPQITGTKRKAIDTLVNLHQSATASGSLTITESQKKSITPITKALIENSVKKVKSFDHLTIIPRNLQSMQQNSRSKSKDNVVDYVELE